MHEHFEHVAPVYSDFRNTDANIIETIVAHLPHRSGPIDIIDIGCGTGRYSELVAKHLHSRNFRFFFSDYSNAMMTRCYERMCRGFPKESINFCRVNANYLPFKDYCSDAIVTFNCIHHFDLDRFVADAAHTLRSGGLLSIYTRTPEQNLRTVWGQYFPKFTEYETRLYPIQRFEHAVNSVSELRFQCILTFTHKRAESPESLLNRARNFHYSTFALYPPDEFERALASFAQKLTDLSISGVVEHTAENTLVLAHRT
jgi:ubiquinone/menaquinone biosynthesis C-methylase UbiE